MLLHPGAILALTPTLSRRGREKYRHGKPRGTPASAAKPVREIPRNWLCQAAGIAPCKGVPTLYDSLAAGQGVEPLAFVASIWGESLPRDVRWTGRDAGYRVAATDLRTDNVADTLAAHGERLACFTMDVSDIVQVHAACDQIEAHFGRIDVCVNNAGFLQYASPERQAELRQKIPVGRFCELEELAHSVLFLAHPLSGFITGEVLDLNGGLQFD